MNSSKIVLFLDFDGVCHRDRARPDEYFKNKGLIEDVIRSFSGLQVVVSSTWKNGYSIDELARHFSEDIRNRFMDVTPSLKNSSDSYVPGHISENPRQWEIETWMKRNRDGDDIGIAIDDRRDWFRENCPWLICTDGLVGCTSEDAKRLTKLIVKRSER